MAGSGRQRRADAALQLRSAVRRLAAEVFGGYVVETPDPGITTIIDSHTGDAVTAVRRAHQLLRFADGHLYRRARAARADGWSWDDIGEALNLAGDGSRSRAEVAFAWLVDGRAPDPADQQAEVSTTSWRCASCDRRVSDYGPCDGSRVEDREIGHATSCGRHAAEAANGTEVADR
jgi:hypothetical protein